MNSLAFVILSLLLSGNVAAHNGAFTLTSRVDTLTIDGNPDDWPAGALATEVGSRGPTRDVDDFAVTFRTAYSLSPPRLYLLVEVTDDHFVSTTEKEGRRRFRQDACEVVIDVHHTPISPGREYGLYGESTRRASDSQAKETKWAHARVAVRILEDRRLYEWVFELEAIDPDLQIGEGSVLGLGLTVYDADEGDRRPGRVTWGKGRRKTTLARARGDLLLLQKDKGLGQLTGHVDWTATGSYPPALVRIAPLGSLNRSIVAKATGGSYHLNLPDGPYRLQVVGEKVAESNLVNSVVVANLETVADTLHATPYDLADYHRPLPPIDGFHRAVSWVAGRGDMNEDVFIPLVKNNVNWIAQTPFGWQRRVADTEIRYRPDAGWWGESDRGVGATARMARKFGIRTLLKPHVWLNQVREGRWRGEIAMENEEDWTTWFTSYEAFIMHYAELAARSDIEALCIGTELHGTVHREREWRELIAKIGAVYDGPLIYAANWHDEFEDVPFWDALDYIGIQAYFPLVDNHSPTVKELRAGWDRHMPSIEGVHQRYDKPILITEIGYHSATDAAIKPWEWDADNTSPYYEDVQTQVNAYEAFFATFWDKPWFAGAYIWKWFPDHTFTGGIYDEEFTPQNKPAEDVMRRWYTRKRESFSASKPD